MLISEQLVSRLEALGLPMEEPAERLQGGDMSQVCRMGRFVIKEAMGTADDQLKIEAAGLKRLQNAGCEMPSVHHVDQSCLVMDYVSPGPAQEDDLAEQLARLHTHTVAMDAPAQAIYIGNLRLEPTKLCTRWKDFWVTQRIAPLLELTDAQLGSRRQGLERLLHTYEPPVEGPCVLHGDLWNGNVIYGQHGACLIDPSVWVGERGVDLAMMKLFGGFGARFWQAYESNAPIPKAVQDALPFYQLYYLLVHVYFFGSSYIGPIDRIIERY